MPRIVYSPRYNMGFLGLERLHPFDSRKYGRAWQVIQRRFGASLRSLHVAPDRPIGPEELLTLHTADYLAKLRDPTYIAKALELEFLRTLPAWVIDWAILRPMRWATHGTVLACREAIKHGLVVNLGGGFHHAKPGGGEGFSIYADAAIAVTLLRIDGTLGETDRIVYVDTDAHQGNGVAHAFMHDGRAFLFDMFNAQIYPRHDKAARQRVDCAVPLESLCGDDVYLAQLREKLPAFLDSVCRSKVGLAIYNAGTDVVSGDPLGALDVSPPAILERDRFVVAELRKRGLATVMVPSGGYTGESYKLIADSVVAILETECRS